MTKVTVVPFFTERDAGLNPSPVMVTVAVVARSPVTFIESSALISTDVCAPPPVADPAEVVVPVGAVSAVVSVELAVEHPAPRRVKVAPIAAAWIQKDVFIEKRVKSDYLFSLVYFRNIDEGGKL